VLMPERIESRVPEIPALSTLRHIQELPQQ